MSGLVREDGMSAENVQYMLTKLEDVQHLLKVTKTDDDEIDCTLVIISDITREVTTFMSEWLNIPQESGNI